LNIVIKNPKLFYIWLFSYSLCCFYY